MRDARQIKLIADALTKQKENYLRELARIMTSMQKKISTIAKMQDYQREYANSTRLHLTHATPSLNKNLQAFIQKIVGVIEQAEKEVVGLKKMQNSLLETIAKLDKKIKLMDIFAARVVATKQYQANCNEQRMLDDLALLKHIRGQHE